MDFQMDAANSTSSFPRKREPMDVAFPPESLWIPCSRECSGALAAERSAVHARPMTPEPRFPTPRIRDRSHHTH